MGILFPSSSHSLETQTKGRRVKGRWIDGNISTISLTADIQAMSGKEIEALTIGNRNLGKVKLYTDPATNLIVADEANNQGGDKITWNGDGNEYEIIDEMPWDHGLINHRKYIGELRVNNDNR